MSEDLIVTNARHGHQVTISEVQTRIAFVDKLRSASDRVTGSFKFWDINGRDKSKDEESHSNFLEIDSSQLVYTGISHSCGLYENDNENTRATKKLAEVIADKVEVGGPYITCEVSESTRSKCTVTANGGKKSINSDRTMNTITQECIPDSRRLVLLALLSLVVLGPAAFLVGFSWGNRFEGSRISSNSNATASNATASNPNPTPINDKDGPASLIIIPPVPWSTTSSLKSGPLVGHTTHHSTKIWAFQGEKKTLEIVYRRSRDNDARKVVMLGSANAANDASIVEIDGLEPATLYTYEVRIQNQNKRVAEGQFKTAPPPGPVKFDYLLASCINARSHQGYPEQPVWDTIFAKEPDFAMLAGDTAVLNDQDWTDTGEIFSDRVWFRNMEQRDESHFARFINSVPIYATWDDHEYGRNNADRNQLGEDNSLKTFENLWANPSHGSPQVTGIYYSYYWGNVHFIVMDNRWNRDPDTGTQFGDDQKEWLYGELKGSQAPFKVIVTGSDVMEPSLSVDVDDIGRVVTNNRISGVIFNAGDIHRNEFKAQESTEWPYKVRQITSSGIAWNWRRSFAIVRVDTEVSDPEITVHFYAANNEDDDTTWSNNPNLRCSDLAVTEHHRCTETIRLSDLTP